MGFRSPGMCFTDSDSSATMTTKKERPLSPKHSAVPSAAIVAPANSDPRIRDRLNWIEFSAIAFGRCFLSTSEGMSD